MTLFITDFLVKKDNLEQIRFWTGEFDAATLQPGQILCKVDKFAFTANNITYALLGDSFKYWQFFPTAETEWGRIPVWGYGNVVASHHPDITPGERLFGYFPLATHLILEPAQVSPRAFIDQAAHRNQLNAIYNQYSRVSADPTYRPEQEGWQALFRPLFITSFLLDDFLADKDFFGGETIVLTSASSKTALGTAFLLNRNRAGRKGYEIIGLTSPRNLDFVEQTGLYDKVFSYGQLELVDNGEPVVLVDFAGNGDLLAQIHQHYQDNLVYSCQVGIAHGKTLTTGRGFPGARPTFFFAPAQLQKRLGEWGGAGFQGRLSQAMTAFLAEAVHWLTIEEGRGPAAITAVYEAFVNGNVGPGKGDILSW